MLLISLQKKVLRLKLYSLTLEILPLKEIFTFLSYCKKDSLISIQILNYYNYVRLFLYITKFLESKYISNFIILVILASDKIIVHRDFVWYYCEIANRIDSTVSHPWNFQNDNTPSHRNKFAPSIWSLQYCLITLLTVHFLFSEMLYITVMWIRSTN